MDLPRVHNGLILPEGLVLPPFLSEPFTDLNEDDLRRLIEDQVGEDVEIDYKVALETSCQEFARDVSAFANTKGGYLVYGMAEENEIPTNLVAIPGFDGGGEIGQLALALGLEPFLGWPMSESVKSSARAYNRSLLE